LIPTVAPIKTKPKGFFKGVRQRISYRKKFIMAYKLIGLSVSKCVLSMVDGTVNPTDVKKIIAGTRCHNEDHWQEVIKEYKEWRWPAEYADQCEALLRQFLKEGKVEVPCITHERVPDLGHDHLWAYWDRKRAPRWFVKRESTIRYAYRSREYKRL
jgi:hypothetical protein